MDRRRDVWLLIVLLGTHLYLGNEFRAFANPNVHSRVYLTLAVADHGTLAIDECVKRYGPVQDIAAYGGRTFSDKPPGYSILLAPIAWALRHTVAAGADARVMAIWLRVLGVSIPVALFWYLTRGYWIGVAGDRRLGLMVLLAGALGTNFFIYATQLFSHALAGVLIFLAYRDAAERSMGRAARCGLLLALAFSVDYIVAPAVVVISLFAVLNRSQARVRGAAALFGAALPIAVMWMAYNQACFDSPFRVGFLLHADPQYGPAYRRGFLGIQRPDPQALIGATLAPPHGLAFLSPFLLVSAIGWWRMAHPRGLRSESIAIAAAVVGILGFVTTTVDWRGGWSVSSRYLTPTIPLLLVGVAAAVRPGDAWRSRFVFRVGAAVGIIQVALIAATFPNCPPTFHDPPYDMAIPMIGAGCVNGTLWDAAALPIAILPFGAIMLGVAGWILYPAGWTGVGCVGVMVATQALVGVRLDYERRLMLADVMGKMGYVCKSDAARAQLHAETLARDPKNAFDLTELAWLRASSPCSEVRDGAKAIELAERLMGVVGRDRADLLDLRAAAYAERGLYDEADRDAQSAILMLDRSGDRSSRERLVAKQAGYRVGRPWRRPAIGR